MTPSRSSSFCSVRRSWSVNSSSARCRSFSSARTALCASITRCSAWPTSARRPSSTCADRATSRCCLLIQFRYQMASVGSVACASASHARRVASRKLSCACRSAASARYARRCASASANRASSSSFRRMVSAGSARKRNLAMKTHSGSVAPTVGFPTPVVASVGASVTSRGAFRGSCYSAPDRRSRR